MSVQDTSSSPRHLREVKGSSPNAPSTMPSRIGWSGHEGESDDEIVAPYTIVGIGKGLRRWEAKDKRTRPLPHEAFTKQGGRRRKASDIVTSTVLCCNVTPSHSLNDGDLYCRDERPCRPWGLRNRRMMVLDTSPIFSASQEPPARSIFVIGGRGSPDPASRHGRRQRHHDTEIRYQL